MTLLGPSRRPSRWACRRCQRLRLGRAYDTCAWCWRSDAIQLRIALDAVREFMATPPRGLSELHKLKCLVDDALDFQRTKP